MPTTTSMSESSPAVADCEASSATLEQTFEHHIRDSPRTPEPVADGKIPKAYKPKHTSARNECECSICSRRLRADQKARDDWQSDLLHKLMEGLKEDRRELKRKREERRRELEAKWQREDEQRRQEAERRRQELEQQQRQESERRRQEAEQKRRDTEQRQRASEERFSSALEEYVLRLQEKVSQRWRDAWTKYTAQGASLPHRLEFTTILWPVLNPPTRTPPQTPDGPPIISGLTRDRLREFLLSPEHSVGVNARARIQAALLRWHPDKMARILDIVVEKDRTAVEEGVNIVAGELAVLLKEVSQARRA